MANEVQIETSPEKSAIIVKKIDFKMVGFTLAGKDYGVDIMKVKEIRKASQFTYVPNTPVYVRGVDNLRGDIIPIIDLRIMFNLPAERREEGELENIIILRLNDLVLGVIVDSIDKVVGISRDSIQPPHPIFGDINVKYISGVVEHEGKLYIILDVERIFGQGREERLTAPPQKAPPPPEVATTDAAPTATASAQETQEELNYRFITEALAAMVGFYASPLNAPWIRKRIEEWAAQRKTAGLEVQFTSQDEAREFLQPFYSDFTDALWDPSVAEKWFQALQFPGSGQILVWNLGCGRGCETYSLAVHLKANNPGRAFKIWANDKDLLNVSMAPSLSFQPQEVPEFYRSFMVETRSGLQFNQDIKAHILFEFHDILHVNPYQDLNLIVARDVLSFLKPQEQESLLDEILDKLRMGGYLILGKNEILPQDRHVTMEPVAVLGLSLYRKKE